MPLNPEEPELPDWAELPEMSVADVALPLPLSCICSRNAINSEPIESVLDDVLLSSAVVDEESDELVPEVVEPSVLALELEEEVCTLVSQA